MLLAHLIKVVLVSVWAPFFAKGNGLVDWVAQPGHCLGLTAISQNVTQCRETCRSNPGCDVWQYDPALGCWQGVPTLLGCEVNGSWVGERRVGGKAAKSPYSGSGTLLDFQALMNESLVGKVNSNASSIVNSTTCTDLQTTLILVKSGLGHH